MARKEKQYHFIYKTTCLLNCKYYYGMHSTDNLKDDYYGSGRRLRRSLNKYGKENHTVEIIEFLTGRTALINREREIVNLNEIAKEDCINLVVGGNGGYISPNGCKKGGINSIKIHLFRCKNDKEYKKYIKEKRQFAVQQRKINGTIKFWNETYNWNGKHHTDETKQKMKKSKNVGIKNPQYGTHWITNGIINKKIKKNECLLIGWRFGRIKI